MNFVYDANTWFSTRYAIYCFWLIREKINKNAVGMNKYRKEREAWILGVALLAIIKLSGCLWWVRIPQDDPPDMLAMKITPNIDKNMNILDYREVEIMEVVKFSKLTLLEEILRKTKKYYPKETCLLVYLRRDTNIVDMRQLSAQLKKYEVNINISDIWILGNTNPKTNDFVLFSLFPDVQVVNFNIDEELKKIPNVNFIEMTKGKGTEKTQVKGVLKKFNPNSKEDYVVI